MELIHNNFQSFVIILAIITLALMLVFWLQGKYQQHKEDEMEFQYEEEMNSRNTLSGLTQLEERVLDIYVQSNIKIPFEIMEELRYLNLDSEDEIFNYIENQRLHWKLENSKKPYRKG